MNSAIIDKDSSIKFSITTIMKYMKFKRCRSKSLFEFPNCLVQLFGFPEVNNFLKKCSITMKRKRLKNQKNHCKLCKKDGSIVGKMWTLKAQVSNRH